MTSILWLRRDLRKHDLPALGRAHEHGSVMPLFVIDPVLWGSAGRVRRAWLAASVLGARESFGELAVRVGRPAEVLPAVAGEVAAGSVHVSAETTPYGRRRDAAVRKALGEVEWQPTGSPYAVGPGLVRKKDDEPYQVFTPFNRAWHDHGWAAPAEVPEGLELLGLDPDDEAEKLLTAAIEDAPIPLPVAGEGAALERWTDFLDQLDDYADARDRPDHPGTSRLSPYLKVGAVHPRTLLADLGERDGNGAATFRTELAWREFYADVLFHRPETAWSDLRPELAGLSYDEPDESFDAWREGCTGFPIVDAGMRQLKETGWMHNRVRMIVASFLAKDLHLWWPHGARHFMEHLLDGDIASNSHGWQWCAGTGTDASPYFRVFNPTTQGKKFDPDGAYVRRWVPEFGTPDYPEPIVDHAVERKLALARYEEARGR